MDILVLHILYPFSWRHEAWIQLAYFYNPGKSMLCINSANFCLCQSIRYCKWLFIFLFVFSPPLLFKDLKQDFSEIHQK